MKGKPKHIMDAMDDFANKQDFLISIGVDKSKILGDIIDQTKPKVVVELGGYLGYSALLFGDKLKQIHGKDSRVKVWSLEFEPRFADIMREIISLAGLDDIVTVVVGSGDDSLRKLNASGDLENIDLLYVLFH
jgi:catechol O-methyltransferase